jgi:hypothetical protein
MKYRLLVFFLLLAAAIVGWRLWRGSSKSKVPHDSAQPGATTPQASLGVASTPLPNNTPPMNKAELISAMLTRTSNTPIALYGKVMDQDGNPVTEAKVRGTAVAVTQWLSDGKKDIRYTATDGAGGFKFEGLHGQGLQIHISKDGYEFDHDDAAFAYGDTLGSGKVYHPNPAAPEVFKMWKLRGPEPLISSEKFFKNIRAGTPFVIDLVKAKMIEGRAGEGDLLITVNQPAELANGQRSDWSFVIEVIDGGLVEAPYLQYNNEAPSEGYAPSVSETMRAAGREWHDHVTKRFFVKSRGEQFALLTVEIYANYQGAVAFGVKYLVNPKPGSRNLEYDPYKRLKPR